MKEFLNRGQYREKTSDHSINFLVKRKNNLNSYRIKNNGKNIIVFYNVQKLFVLQIVFATVLIDNSW